MQRYTSMNLSNEKNVHIYLVWIKNVFWVTITSILRTLSRSPYWVSSSWQPAGRSINFRYLRRQKGLSPHTHTHTHTHTHKRKRVTNRHTRCQTVGLIGLSPSGGNKCWVCQRKVGWAEYLKYTVTILSCARWIHSTHWYHTYVKYSFTTFEGLRLSWVGNIKMDLQEAGLWGGDLDWIDLAQDRDRWRALVFAIMNLRVP